MIKGQRTVKLYIKKCKINTIFRLNHSCGKCKQNHLEKYIKVRGYPFKLNDIIVIDLELCYTCAYDLKLISISELREEEIKEGA